MKSSVVDVADNVVLIPHARRVIFLEGHEDVIQQVNNVHQRAINKTGKYYLSRI